MPDPSNPTRPACLWITRQDPSAADSGELIYSGGLLQALATTGSVDLTVLAHRGRTDPHPIGGCTMELRGTIPTGRIASLVSSLPGDAYRLGNPVQRATLQELLDSKPWNWIIIDQAACGWALSCLRQLPSRPRVAYIAHNHESPLRRQIASAHRGSLPFRAALRWDAWKYARLENDLARQADLVTAITPRDQAEFQACFPGKPVICLPPGYGKDVPAEPPAGIRPETPRRVVLAGAFEWIAKRHNLEDFLAAASEPFRASMIELHVVGKADPGYFKTLGTRYPWARFIPNVPSIDPWLADARIGLIPEALGGGFKLKALDYVFRGLPLAAIADALSGVPVDPAHDAITSATVAGLAREVAARIDDIRFLQQAASNAFHACRDAFRWRDRGEKLATALLSMPRP